MQMTIIFVIMHLNVYKGNVLSRVNVAGIRQYVQDPGRGIISRHHWDVIEYIHFAFVIISCKYCLNKAFGLSFSPGLTAPLTLD